ncbi:transmembrane protein 79 [Myripristis murdjan]|uniref:Transmembrane protein 79b n=1 Tax=Myripristis murdjan TaxID=586833 RepID=A0A668A5Y6_9TELE|nr:transmembrane protein 79-like [Myripristis murdjan]XP_029929108.1 transmembrane protein 79-like [Myripristis murdjan]
MSRRGEELTGGPTWSSEEDKMKLKKSEEEENMVKSAWMEPSTLQWPGDRQTDRQTDRQLDNRGSVGGEERKEEQGEGERRSVRSECISFQGAESQTESERELLAGGGGRRTGGEEEERKELELRRGGQEEGGQENFLPEKAAQVFSPAVTVLQPASPRDTEAFWEMESEKSPFLGPGGIQDEFHYQQEPKCGCVCPSRDGLKVGVSLFTSALFFPFLVWGGFVFLPFDAPLLDSAPLRLVYTLRCSVFAAVPIVLGWLVLGVSRLRTGELRPLEEGLTAAAREANVHRRFVADSTSLFLIYFLQLVVMAMYLSQEQLKLIPLLTIVFALGRLLYWLAAVLSSSVRGFGFGLSFLPSLVMLAANIYFIFTVEAAGSIYAAATPPEPPPPPPPARQRFWG